jgi:hypothetical protein
VHEAAVEAAEDAEVVADEVAQPESGRPESEPADDAEDAEGLGAVEGDEVVEAVVEAPEVHEAAVEAAEDAEVVADDVAEPEPVAEQPRSRWWRRG